MLETVYTSPQDNCHSRLPVTQAFPPNTDARSLGRGVRSRGESASARPPPLVAKVSLGMWQLGSPFGAMSRDFHFPRACKPSRASHVQYNKWYYQTPLREGPSLAIGGPAALNDPWPWVMAIFLDPAVSIAFAHRHGTNDRRTLPIA